MHLSSESKQQIRHDLGEVVRFKTPVRVHLCLSLSLSLSLCLSFSLSFSLYVFIYVYTHTHTHKTLKTQKRSWCVCVRARVCVYVRAYLCARAMRGCEVSQRVTLLERVCCLMVLNLVTSTPQCIRQPGPRDMRDVWVAQVSQRVTLLQSLLRDIPSLT